MDLATRLRLGYICMQQKKGRLQLGLTNERMKRKEAREAGKVQVPKAQADESGQRRDYRRQAHLLRNLHMEDDRFDDHDE